MIYGNRFLNEGFGGESSQINKELDSIYEEGKAAIKVQQSISVQAFKSKEYAKVKAPCNKIISICKKSIGKINDMNTTNMNGIGRAKRKKYINYFTAMMDDAKVAIEEAEKRQ